MPDNVRVSVWDFLDHRDAGDLADWLAPMGENPSGVDVNSNGDCAQDGNEIIIYRGEGNASLIERLNACVVDEQLAIDS